MARVWCVWSPSGGQENFEVGMKTSTWGLPREPTTGTFKAGDLVLFGMGVPGGPRISVDKWNAAKGSVALGEVTSSMYLGEAPHWPDEVAEGLVKYPHRFAFRFLGFADDVPMSSAFGPLDADTSMALRNSGVGGFATLVPDAETAGLAAILGIEVEGDQLRPSIDGLAAIGDDDDEIDNALSNFSGAGRTSDPLLRTAVEKHAVAMAVEHMTSLGWTDIQELGKPYDLVCRRTGEEKHVEVKGTTGAGGTVIYTRNEVAHFRSCPHGADLIVVREITVDRTSVPYGASGGTLLHLPNYEAPGADLSPLSFEGRVSW